MDSKQLVAELIKGNVEEFKKGFSELLAERIEEKMCKLRAESLSDVGLKVLGDEEVEPELEDGQEMLTEPEMEDEEDVEGEVDVEDGDLESDEEEDLEVEPEEGEEPELESDEESEDDAEEIEDADDVEDTQVVSVDVDDDVSQVRVELQLSDEEDE